MSDLYFDMVAKDLASVQLDGKYIGCIRRGLGGWSFHMGKKRIGLDADITRVLASKLEIMNNKEEI